MSSEWWADQLNKWSFPLFHRNFYLQKSGLKWTSSPFQRLILTCSIEKDWRNAMFLNPRILMSKKIARLSFTLFWPTSTSESTRLQVHRELYSVRQKADKRKSDIKVLHAGTAIPAVTTLNTFFTLINGYHPETPSTPPLSHPRVSWVLHNPETEGWLTSLINLWGFTPQSQVIFVLMDRCPCHRHF